MHVGAAPLRRAAEADRGLHDDQRGAAVIRAGALDGRRDLLDVVAVLDVLALPAVGLEASVDLLGEGEVGAALDADVVVVVEVDQPPEAERARQGGGLGGNPLHEVAVADDPVDVVVDDLAVGPVEVLGEKALGDGHADAGGEARAERAGGQLDARRMAVLGVAGGAAAPLPELLKVLERDVVAAEVKQRVEQHRGVAGREHEAIAVRPAGVPRVVTEEAGPERVRHRGGAHRRAGVARVGLLHAVDGEGADGIDAELVEGAIRRHAWYRPVLRDAGRASAERSRGLRADCTRQS